MTDIKFKQMKVDRVAADRISRLYVKFFDDCSQLLAHDPMLVNAYILDIVATVLMPVYDRKARKFLYEKMEREAAQSRKRCLEHRREAVKEAKEMKLKKQGLTYKVSEQDGV